MQKYNEDETSQFGESDVNKSDVRKRQEGGVREGKKECSGCELTRQVTITINITKIKSLKEGRRFRLLKLTRSHQVNRFTTESHDPVDQSCVRLHGLHQVKNQEK